MISTFWRAILSVLGIPEDEDAAFYGQLALNLVFCVAAFGAFAKIAFDRADKAFGSVFRLPFWRVKSS